MKYMNLKRFASTALAGVMAVSMMTPALAADHQTVIEGAYQATEIAVTVPDSGTAIINPYGLPIDLDEESTISGEQITTAAPLVISNQGKVGMKVTFNGKVEPNGEVTLATGGTPAADKKDIIVNFEAFSIDELLDTADTATLNSKFKDLKSANANVSQTLTANATDAGDTIVLREGVDGASQAGSQAFVRLSGTVTKAPTDDTKQWKDTDTFTATIIYKFEPATYSKEAGAVEGAGGVSSVNNKGSLVVNLTPELPNGVTVDTWTWASSDESVATVVVDGSDSKKATVTNELADTSGTADGTVDITVSGTGSNGLPYSAKITLTCKGKT